jgi:hypothetical protein
MKVGRALELVIGTAERNAHPAQGPVPVYARNDAAGNALDVGAAMLPTTMRRGPIDLSTRTPRSTARFSVSALSDHSPFSAAFTTNIAESDFRYTQPLPNQNLVRIG